MGDKRPLCAAGVRSCNPTPPAQSPVACRVRAPGSASRSARQEAMRPRSRCRRGRGPRGRSRRRRLRRPRFHEPPVSAVGRRPSAGVDEFYRRDCNCGARRDSTARQHHESSLQNPAQVFPPDAPFAESLTQQLGHPAHTHPASRDRAVSMEIPALCDGAASLSATCGPVFPVGVHGLADPRHGPSQARCNLMSGVSPRGALLALSHRR